jgi:CPA2 family monovalent cation:H+ antiporter-2
MKPIRDMFSAVFFVAIGLLIDPNVMVDYWFPIMVITIVVVFGKVFTCSIGTFVTGNDVRTSLRVGMGLAQIGEFSFIIAALGITLGATSHFLYPITVAVSVITTLLTPYLIRSADFIAEGMNVKPLRPLYSYLQVYTNLVGHWQEWKKDLTVSLIRKWIYQIVLNIVVIFVIFFLTIFLVKKYTVQMQAWLGDIAQQKAFWWFTAMLFSLPLLIASFRKIQSLGILVAEISTKYEDSNSHNSTKYQIITQTITVIGTLGMILIVLILSSTILPPTNLFFILAGAIVLIAFLFWVPFIKLHAKAQITLQEIFTQNHPPEAPKVGNLIEISQQSNLLETISVETNSAWIGKRIRDLNLRHTYGISIVAIHRDNDDVINPHADEVIRLEDQVTVLGTEKGLKEFKKSLAQA